MKKSYIILNILNFFIFIKKYLPSRFLIEKKSNAKSNKEIIFYLAKNQSTKQIKKLIPTTKFNLVADIFETCNLEELKKRKTIILEPSKMLNFKEPKIFEEHSSRPIRRVSVPEKKITQINNATIIGAFQILCNEKLIITEETENPHNHFVAGIWPYIQSISDEKKNVIVWFEYTKKLSLNQGILLSGRCSPNYFHWLIEYLGRAYIISKFEKLKNIPLIVDEHMFDSEFESLQAVLPDWPIIKVPRNTLVTVKKLFIPSINTYHPDRIDLPYWKTSAVCFETLRFLKDTVLKNLDLNKNQITQKRKIFITRKDGNHSGRNILNNTEIENLMKKLKFEVIDPSELSFKEQVRTFMECSVIVGAMGAAFTNIIFCQPGTKIIALCSPYHKRFCMQSNLAIFSECDYTILPGIHSKYREGAEFSENDINITMDKYSISAKKLELMIKVLYENKKTSSFDR